jgi:chitin disaccharide deacetylase
MLSGVETNSNSRTENSVRRKKLIVTADDLGLTRRVNEAIETAHREGIVTTASLMVNGSAFESAVEIIKKSPELGAGLHLNLTEGGPVARPDQIPSLADENGFLYRHPFQLMLAILRHRVHRADIEKEIRAQLGMASQAGVLLLHLDGHKHVHVIPQVFEIACRVAPDYGIRAVRSTVERAPGLTSLLARNAGFSGQIIKQYCFGKALSVIFSLNKPSLKTPTRLYGITQTGFLDINAFTGILRRLPDGVSEVMCHPGYVDDDLKRTPTRLHFQRERELKMLTAPEIRGLLEDSGVSLATYRDLEDCGNRI